MSEADNYSEILSESFHESDGFFSEVESDYNPDGEEKSTKKMKYRVITEDKRKTLIDLIEVKGLSIAKAAKRVGVKYSTAKTIYGVFQTEGRVTTKLRRGVGAEKKKNTPKKEYKKKEKVSKTQVIDTQESPTEDTRMKTRASQRIKQVVNIEPEKIQLPAVKDKAVETLEPALTKVIKTEDQGRISQIPVIRPELCLPMKGFPVGMQAPMTDVSKEQQLLLARLNYLIASGSFGLQGPLSTPPLAMKTPSLEDLLRMGRPSVLPTGLGSSNHLMLRNSWASPFLGNIGHPLLFSNNFKNPLGNFKS